MQVWKLFLAAVDPIFLSDPFIGSFIQEFLGGGIKDCIDFEKIIGGWIGSVVGFLLN